MNEKIVVSNSKNARNCEVVSAFFSDNVMDDSADFQDKKKSIVRPNNIKKNSDAVIKNKRKVKKIKGQKDIRTALKQKKSELVKYTKEFNEVCQLSGIDVDSEQLQIAIALSKSLVNCEADSSLDTEASKSYKINTTSKIRTTLQEYGFKVPEIKLAKKVTKRKRANKLYKLLTVSEPERQQIIADKYSQVLFENICAQEGSQEITATNSLFYLTTNVVYSEIKDLNKFYVKGLFELLPNSTGSLLKDWSIIPGRPLSPCQNHRKSGEFSNLSCSQLDLDKILSGSIVIAQSIVKDKIEVDHVPLAENIDNKDFEGTNKSIMDVNKDLNYSKGMLDVKSDPGRSCSPDIFGDEIDDTILENSCNNQGLISPVPATTLRSINDFMDLTECVPQISQNSTKNIILSQGSNETKKKSNDFMEITDCIASSSQPILVNAHIDLSLSKDQEKKTLKEHIKNYRSSVEIETVPDIDLTEDILIDKSNVQHTKHMEIIDNMDLTQSSDSNEALPAVPLNNSNKSQPIESFFLVGNKHTETPNNSDSFDVEILKWSYDPLGPTDIKTVYSNKEDILDLTLEIQTSPNEQKKSSHSKDDNINITIERENPDIAPINKNVLQTKEVLIDLTQNESICNENRSAKISVESLGKTNDVPVDHSSHFNNNSTEDINTCESDDTIIIPTNEIALIADELHIDLAKNESICNENISSKISVEGSNSMNHYSVSHGSHSKNSVIENIEHCESENSYSAPSKENDSTSIEHIDLTENETINNENTSCKVSFGSLGKMDDVSVDYDEICFENNAGLIEYIPEERSVENCDDNLRLQISQENSPEHSFSHNENHSNENNLSQQSAVFEISDNELDYSMQQSKLENQKNNFEVGGISILDNTSKRNSYSSNRIHRSISESFLPEVNVIKKANTETDSPIIAKSQPSTPLKLFNSDVKDTFQTPKGEYIVKTDQVTPMLDYASLSTPERNKELDKYGLKPFKRKRAIQLLTHLYNQTHPIVESVEDLPSPSKRLRIDTNSQPSVSQKTLTSSKQGSNKSKTSEATNKTSNQAPKRPESPIKEVTNKENNLVYEVTSLIPDIKNIECDPEDWVFQKREKAKIKTCRLPLHIAFHNYVSCRIGLQEAILRYEPVHIDLIHKDLVAMGLKYNPKDLLKFLDKRCITVKTADNNSRNIKK